MVNLGALALTKLGVSLGALALTKLMSPICPCTFSCICGPLGSMAVQEVSVAHDCAIIHNNGPIADVHIMLGSQIPRTKRSCRSTVSRVQRYSDHTACAQCQALFGRFMGSMSGLPSTSSSLSRMAVSFRRQSAFVCRSASWASVLTNKSS